MADQKRPAKKVVKKVVKKAPVRPEPQIRYGRPTNRPATPAKAKVASASKDSVKTGRGGAKTAVREAPSDAVETPKGRRRPQPPKPSMPKKSMPNVDVSGGIDSARDRMVGLGSGAVTVWRRIIGFFSDLFWWVVDTVRSLRLPKLEPVPASLVTGAVIGLIAVGLSLGALEMFEWLRGVASGGGTWGSLTFVVVAFIAFALGELLLSGFGTPAPRLTSFLGVVLTIVTILGLFLEESDTRMALVIVPAIAASAFTIAHWLMAAAEASTEETR